MTSTPIDPADPPQRPIRPRNASCPECGYAFNGGVELVNGVLVCPECGFAHSVFTPPKVFRRKLWTIRAGAWSFLAVIILVAIFRGGMWDRDGVSMVATIAAITLLVVVPWYVIRARRTPMTGK